MELILKEWIGTGNEYIKLDDISIVELNVQHYISTKNEEDVKTKIAARKKIKGKNKIRNIDIEKHRSELNTIIKEEIQSIITLIESRNIIISETDKINKQHKNKLNKEDVNPIIEFIEIKNELYVKTYQYAAEFEIKLEKKKTLKIKIEPRNLISVENFKIMLGTIFNFHKLENISGEKSNSFLILYYLAFIGRLKEVLKNGLYREYIDLEENLNFLKEKIVISEHLRLNRYNKHKVYCEFSELTPDNLINQTIKTTLNLIQKYFRGYSILQNEIRKIKDSFFNDDVGINKVNINSINNIRYNRQNKRYEEIMNYCKNILQNIGGSFSAENKMTYSAFYIDMNELFEKYVEKKLIETSNMINNGEDKDEDKDKDGFCKIRDLIHKQLNGNENKSFYIETQNQAHYYLDDEKVFKIKPDFLIKNNNGEVIAVADAKYKRLNNNKEKNYGISSSDVYQLLSYSYKFNTNTIILIYPKPPNYYENDLNFTLKIDNSNSKTLHICYIDLISEKN